MSSFLNAYASKALPLQAETCSMVSGQTSQELERPYPGVETQADDSWYDGMGDALFGGVAGAYYETMSTAQTLLGNAAGKVDKDWEAQLDEWAKENRKIAQQQYAPDPELSTTAAQIVYGASKELSKIGLAAAAALPLTALGAPGAAVGGAFFVIERNDLLYQRELVLFEFFSDIFLYKFCVFTDEFYIKHYYFLR